MFIGDKIKEYLLRVHRTGHFRPSRQRHTLLVMKIQDEALRIRRTLQGIDDAKFD